MISNIIRELIFDFKIFFGLEIDNYTLISSRYVMIYKHLFHTIIFLLLGAQTISFLNTLMSGNYRFDIYAEWVGMTIFFYIIIRLRYSSFFVDSHVFISDDKTNLLVFDPSESQLITVDKNNFMGITIKESRLKDIIVIQIKTERSTKNLYFIPDQYRNSHLSDFRLIQDIEKCFKK